MNRQIIKTANAPEAVGMYSQGVLSANFVYTSGQIPIDPKTGDLITEDITGEIRQVLKNLNAVLLEGGSSLNSAVKLTVFLTDLHYFSDVNKVFKEFFTNKSPARSTVQVSALPMGARVEIEAIGIIE